jgi:hypothetical protein
MGQIMSAIPELESGAEEKAAKGASQRHAEPYAGSTSGEGSVQSVADVFEQGFARIRDTHEKMSEVLEDASEAFNQAFTIANRGSIEFPHENDRDAARKSARLARCGEASHRRQSL